MYQVLDYVNQKSREYELRGHVRNLERKIEIAEIGAKRARALLREAIELGLPAPNPDDLMATTSAQAVSST